MSKHQWICRLFPCRVVYHILWFLVVGVMVSGCATVPTHPQIPLSPEKTQEVLNSLQEKQARIFSAKGLFRASITGSGLPISQNLDGILFYRRPNSVRLKGFTRVGGVVFDFVRNQEFYQLTLPANGRFITGRLAELPEEEDLSQLIRLSLRAMDAILGKVDKFQPGRALLYENGHGYLLDVPPLDQLKVDSGKSLTMRL